MGKDQDNYEITPAWDNCARILHFILNTFWLTNFFSYPNYEKKISVFIFTTSVSMETYFAELKMSFSFFCRRSKVDQIVESLWPDELLSLGLELQLGFTAIQMIRTDLPSSWLSGHHPHLRRSIRCSRPWGPVCNLRFRFQSVMLSLWTH